MACAPACAPLDRHDGRATQLTCEVQHLLRHHPTQFANIHLHLDDFPPCELSVRLLHNLFCQPLFPVLTGRVTWLWFVRMSSSTQMNGAASPNGQAVSSGKLQDVYLQLNLEMKNAKYNDKYAKYHGDKLIGVCSIISRSRTYPRG